MKRYLLAILTLISFQAYACDCDEVTKASIDELLQKADFVFIGTPLKNVFYVEDVLDYLDSRGEGADILVSVDSVLKGDFKSNTVFVNQEGVGDCLQMFRLGESYLIFGYEINQYVNSAPDEIDMLNDSVPAPPSPSIFKDGIVTDFSSTREYSDFYNRMLSQYSTMTTNQCISFIAEPRVLKLFHSQ